MKLHLSMLTKSIMSGMAVALFAGTASAGSIVGSPHDMSGETWTGADPVNGIQGQICVTCHAPHNAVNPNDGPLWNHDLPGSTYILYSSPLNTLDGTIDANAPNGASFLCLSCHDGSVALDAFGGQAGSQYIAARFQLGSDLSNDHPVGITYDDTTAAADKELYAPSTTDVTIGTLGDVQDTGPIARVMLENGGTVQCTSCHDVHNKYTQGAKFLKITRDGSKICLACHMK